MRPPMMEPTNLGLTMPCRSEIGMRIPLLAGAGGWVLPIQLKDAEMDDILAENELRNFMPNSCVGKEKFKKKRHALKMVRQKNPTP